MKTRLSKVFGFALAIFAISGLVQNPAGAVLIDDFETGNQSLSYSANETLDRDTGAGPGIIGTERDLEIRDRGFEAGGAASLDIQNGLFDWQLTDGLVSDAAVTIIWDGAGDAPIRLDPSGLGVQDLTQGGATAFYIYGVSTTHETFLSIAAHGATFIPGAGSVVVPANTSNGIFQIPFSSFPASVDFTAIGGLKLIVGFPPSSVAAPVSLQIEEINTTEDAVPVDMTSWGGIKAIYR